MKEKIVMILAVLLMAAPALATVNFVAEDVGGGSGQLKISYTCDDGELPRGVALKITITGDGEIVEPEDALPGGEAAYNTYIDYANSNPVDYVVGLGHPFADPTGAGVVTFPASEFSVCMGVLDETGNQLPGPGTSANLITIQLHGSGTVDVVVDADYSRAPDGGGGGGAVGSTLDTNLPLATVQVDLGDEPDCMMATHPDHAMWVIRGKPDCWCYKKQCHGDADGKNGPQPAGPFPVSGDDLTILALGINTLPLPAGVDAECADFDHKNGPQPAGPFPVSGDDLTELALYINSLPGPAECDGTHINEWLVP